MSKTQNKIELLKNKVVDLVKEFVKAEGGMKICDIDYAIEQITADLRTKQTILFGDQQT